MDYQVLLAKDLAYIDGKVYAELRSAYERIGQMLTKLAQSLDRR